MDLSRDQEQTFSAHEAARAAGISKNTLLRWLKQGKVPEVRRDRNGWRVFSPLDVETITAFARKTTPPAAGGPVPGVTRETQGERAGEAA